jgi:hypothetical protein
MPNKDRAEDNRKNRDMTRQVDTTSTSGDSQEKDMKDSSKIWTAAAPAAPQVPTKFPTGEDTQLSTENE